MYKSIIFKNFITVAKLFLLNAANVPFVAEKFESDRAVKQDASLKLASNDYLIITDYLKSTI